MSKLIGLWKFRGLIDSKVLHDIGQSKSREMCKLIDF